MNRYYVNFFGFVEVDAQSEDEAREKFWNKIGKAPDQLYFHDYEWTVDCVETSYIDNVVSAQMWEDFWYER